MRRTGVRGCELLQTASDPGSSKRRWAVPRAIWLVHSRSPALVSRQPGGNDRDPGQFGLRPGDGEARKPTGSSPQGNLVWAEPADVSAPARTLRR